MTRNDSAEEPVSRARTGPFSRRLVFLASALSLVAAGFVLGRLDRVHEIAQEARARAFKPSWRSPWPALPPLGDEGRSYEELTRALDRHLLDKRSTAPWRQLATAPDLEAYAEGAEVIRDELAAVLSPWPGPREKLDPVTESWFSTEGVEASLVRFETQPDVTLLCLLLRPVDRPDERRAGILALHGLGGTLGSLAADVDYHHGFAIELARRGFVVLAPVRATGNWTFRGTLAHKATALGWRLEALELWQLVRALDYLYALPGIDPDHVGLYGISFGGRQALILGALDRRPTLVLVSGYFTDRFRWMLSAYRTGGSRLHWLPEGELLRELGPNRWIDFLPAMDPLLDDRNLAALVVPRYFGVESGTRDPRHREAAAVYDDVAAFYGRMGIPERSAFLPFDGDHEISVPSALPFLERWVADPRPGDAREPASPKTREPGATAP